MGTKDWTNRYRRTDGSETVNWVTKIYTDKITERDITEISIVMTKEDTERLEEKNRENWRSTRTEETENRDRRNNAKYVTPPKYPQEKKGK